MHLQVVVAVETFQPKGDGPEAELWTDELTFLNLLFGFKSFGELDDMFADFYARQSMIPLVNILFPKKGSNVWAVS